MASRSGRSTRSASNAADARIIILGAVEPFDAAALESLPRLEGVVRRGVGTDNVDLEAATRLGIVVAHVTDASVDEVSDHALALLLALERQLQQLDRGVRSGAWARDASADHRPALADPAPQRPHPRDHRSRPHRPGTGSQGRPRSTSA